VQTLESGFRVADWLVSPQRDCIERGDEVVHLAPKAMSVLVCLASASGEVVSRRDLFETVWPGGEVSDDALTQRIVELRKAFDDSAQNPAIIETIPKIGFRLIPPIVPLSERAESMPKPGPDVRRKNGLKWLVFTALGVLLLAIVINRFWTNGQSMQEPLTGAVPPSIAVLPFVNMSSDPENEYFSEGLSEELLNLLAAVPGLDVISRSSSFSFKGKDLKIPEIAEELNASLILEGTVRKTGHRLRITAQLIEAHSDRHLWSNTYDRELSDIFALQEEIAQSILVAMQDEIGVQTIELERPTEDIEAYELFLAGRHRFYQRGPDIDRAILALKSAVAKDPEFAQAWAYLAAAAAVAWGYMTEIGDEEAHQVAVEAANRALELEPGMGLALAVLGAEAWGYDGDLLKAFSLYDRAYEANPRDTTIRLWIGVRLHQWGYLESALPHLVYAHQHNPWVGITNGCLGLLYLALGQDIQAHPYLEKAGELGWLHHYYARAAQSMMRGDYDTGFANLRFIVTGVSKEPELLGWIAELDKAGRAYFNDPASLDQLAAVIDEAPFGIWDKTILALIFGLKDPFFEYFSRTVETSHRWFALMRVGWLPEYRSFVEDPRFLEIMRGEGAVELWDQRGYPDGCIFVNDPNGDHLDCSIRYE
jgi:TolB-like protein/DNA-binding winged helix-turn-helix (wHTH) protein